MYLNLRAWFYWPNMKRDVAEYTRTCDSCQRNKAVTQKKGGLLQPAKKLENAHKKIKDFERGLDQQEVEQQTTAADRAGVELTQ